MVRRLRRGFTLIEILVVVGIIAIAMSFLLMARPGRAALRIELVTGHKQIAEFALANVSKKEQWNFKIPHCERLVRFCEEEPLYREILDAEGLRGDPDVKQFQSLINDWHASLLVWPYAPSDELLAAIDAMREAIELRYLKLAPPEL